jgi:carbonic anhydrase/acetyltransferase-like protein (isoleucine patch superfamily)
MTKLKILCIQQPAIANGVFVAPNATLIGAVQLQSKSSVSSMSARGTLPLRLVLAGVV